MMAQLEADRMAAIKRQLLLEERLKSLERKYRAFNIRVQSIQVGEKQNLKDAVVNTFNTVVPSLKKIPY